MVQFASYLRRALCFLVEMALVFQHQMNHLEIRQK